ncbi:MAG: molybdopterin oxidoreductase [Deltaproteobacteria bacterium]|nr:molybdopterin oxidoreductase [Deltaproteobacteria bacterium]
MSASHAVTVPTPKKYEWSSKAKSISLLLAALGVATFIFTLKSDPQRAWANFLTDYFFWLCIGLSGVFFTALQHITGAYWSVTVRRISESFISYLPVAAVLFVVLLFGIHHLYEWTHTDVVAHDEILKSKAGYLNPTFFMIRQFGLLAFVLILGGWMVKNSLRQDSNGNVKLTELNTKISAPFLLFFAWLFTFGAFDLMMSLAPHWFSTIFGIYCWSGLFYSGLATITMITIHLRKKGILSDFVTEHHLHDLGKLMFAFTVFWGYIAFSQYMLIWYANLPEETPYMITRTMGAWKSISIALAVGKFVIPFFLLIGKWAKKWQNYLYALTFWFLAAQWLDIYWMVFPTFYKTPIFGLTEVLMFFGFAGIFFFCVGNFLSKVTVVPIKDPRIEECLAHHQF